MKKIYATISSESGSKGHGGNEFLEIELKVVDRDKPVGILVLEYHNDTKDHKADSDEWVLKYASATGQGYDDYEIIDQGNIETKGKVKDCKIDGCMGAAYPSGYCKRHGA